MRPRNHRRKVELIRRHNWQDHKNISLLDASLDPAADAAPLLAVGLTGSAAAATIAGSRPDRSEMEGADAVASRNDRIVGDEQQRAPA